MDKFVGLTSLLKTATLSTRESGAMVAHLLPKQRVAGSNPVSRSSFTSSECGSPPIARWASRCYSHCYSQSPLLTVYGPIGAAIVGAVV